MQFFEQKDKDKILIVDFGSQVTKLIARRVRDLGVYYEIITPNQLNLIKEHSSIKGIIFSGGPSTVTAKKYQSVSKEIFKKKNTNIGNMLWTSANSKNIWRKN